MSHTGGLTILHAHVVIQLKDVGQGLQQKYSENGVGEVDAPAILGSLKILANVKHPPDRCKAFYSETRNARNAAQNSNDLVTKTKMEDLQKYDRQT